MYAIRLSLIDENWLRSGTEFIQVLPLPSISFWPPLGRRPGKIWICEANSRIFPVPLAKGWAFYFLLVFFSPQYDTLEGAHSFAQFLRQISPFSRHFLETLTETGSIHWVGVQTWLRSSHEGKRWWHPRGGSFVCAVLDANLLLFAPLFRNTNRDRFYTLGRCSNLAAKQPWR